ncbi:MAG: lysozyme [Cellulosilyticaceae bacterium]
MQINPLGIKLIKQFEGCSLKAYKLPGEQYFTIGYGHSFDPSITATTVWTQKQADDTLIKDLQSYCKHVDTVALAKFKNLNANQCNALMSYCYNRGKGGLHELVSHSGTVEELGHNIVVYWGSAMRYKNGLVRRRKAEEQLFFTAI